MARTEHEAIEEAEQYRDEEDDAIPSPIDDLRKKRGRRPMSPEARAKIAEAMRRSHAAKGHKTKAASEVVSYMKSQLPVRKSQPEQIMQPIMIKFEMGRTANDWERFLMTWQSHYRNYALDHVYERRDDESVLDVGLRPIQPKSCDESE